MATTAETRLSSRRFASPQIRALIRRRLAELGSIGVALVGFALLVALATYHPGDPSLDTATSVAPRNLAGPIGAILADLLLQGFGLAGALPGVALLAWAWRIGGHRPLTLRLRLPCLIAAIPAVAAVLGGIPGRPAWPVASGAGGAVGSAIAGTMLQAGRGVLGPLGGTIVAILGIALSATLALLALGLSAAEWRAVGRNAAGVGAGALNQGRRAAGLLSRLAALRRVLPLPRRGEPSRPEPDDRRGPPLPAAHQFVPSMAEEDDVAAGEVPVARAAVPVVAPAPPRLARPRVTPPAPKPVPRQESLPLAEGGEWVYPTLALLKPPPARAAAGPTEEALENNARLLETVLSDYGVQGAIREIRPGPVVTLYELEPAPGIRSARVIGLADDIARSLSVTAVRIATVPGRNVIGIEVPNSRRETVYLSELLGSADWERQQGRLSLALGKDIGGTPVIADLSRMPHLLIAGTTGSGKSVGVNAMILSLLYRLSPEQCRLILIDPKMLELSVYDGIPHLMAPVVTEPAKAVTALKWTVREMERRYRAMSQLGVRNIAGYNDRVAEARARGETMTRRVQTGFDSETGRPMFEEQPLALQSLPLLVVVIDEMADLMMVAGKEIEAAVQRLAQMARAAGIHVIMATQRPSVDVITGTIKANFPTRISFQVISKFDSRTILGEQGAEQLLGQGDMLYMAGGGRITRVHGPFVSDREVEEVVAFLREQGEPAYLDEVTEPVEDAAGGTPSLSGIAGATEGEKGLFDQAVALVAREGKASTSFIQRHLAIGYNRAAKLIEQMEKEGVVGPANHVGKREVLVRRTDED
ncbi:MAG TPA: DNA translocase FtsK [Acetobacteraceae bacterium]|nr:DNA translocase FtsK [Acetobacteraceae bacterium]